MVYKELKLTTGESIHIFDQIFKPHEIHYWHEFAELSKYRIQTSSSGITYQKADIHIQSSFDSEDLDKFSMLKSEGFQHIRPLISNRVVERSWLLLSHPVSHYYFHPDNHQYNDGKTLLYYVNNKWDRDWGGETLFHNTDGELEIAVEFKPGRAIIFDSHLVHRNTPPSIKSNAIRISFVIQFCHPVATVKT